MGHLKEENPCENLWRNAPKTLLEEEAMASAWYFLLQMREMVRTLAGAYGVFESFARVNIKGPPVDGR